MKQGFEQIFNDIPSYTRFLQVREIDELMKLIVKLSGVTHRIIGKTMNGEPLYVIDIGNGDHTALILGVPHSDEPLGSLVVTFFARWLALHREVKSFGWRWLFVPIVERRGMQLNEGWFTMPNSFSVLAKYTFRHPTEDQYEWTFPIQYEEYEWFATRPETWAVQHIIEEEKPDLLCALHHCGFHNAYFYLSKEFSQVYEPLRKLAESVRLPLSDSAPNLP